MGTEHAAFLGVIDPDKTYTWYSGIWHGMFFISNFIRSWFTDVLYKAESYTEAYNVFWWIFNGLSVFSFFLWRRCQKKMILMWFMEFRHASQKSVMNGIIKRNNWGYHKKSDWLWQRVQEMK